MSRMIKASVVVLAFLLCGCAAKKPVIARYSGVICGPVYLDKAGTERRDCQCRNAKQIGLDAKSRALIVKCE